MNEDVRKVQEFSRWGMIHGEIRNEVQVKNHTAQVDVDGQNRTEQNPPTV